METRKLNEKKIYEAIFVAAPLHLCSSFYENRFKFNLTLSLAQLDDYLVEEVWRD